MTAPCTLFHKLLSPGGKASDFFLNCESGTTTGVVLIVVLAKMGSDTWSDSTANVSQIALLFTALWHILFKASFEGNLRLRLIYNMLLAFQLFPFYFFFLFALDCHHNCCLLVFYRSDCWGKPVVVCVKCWCKPITWLNCVLEEAVGNQTIVVIATVSVK